VKQWEQRKLHEVLWPCNRHHLSFGTAWSIVHEWGTVALNRAAIMQRKMP